ncbi:MAG: hypothetical protein IPK83_18000 [Planctomycetes bacterium]|nr:hypothetical protein [Planctomycetota bacterium]
MKVTRMEAATQVRIKKIPAARDGLGGWHLHEFMPCMQFWTWPEWTRRKRQHQQQWQ